MWVPVPPSAYAALAGATVLANLSGSPITVARAEDRRLLVRSASARCLAAYVYAAAGEGESTHRPVLGRPDDGLRVRRPARRERALPRRAAAHRRRRRPRPDPPGAAAPGHLRRQPARRGDAAGRFREIEFTLDPPTGDIGLRRKVDRFPFVPDDVERLALDCYEAYNIQVSGLEQRLARDRPAQGRHRRLRWPRLHARADRRGQGDGPARPAAQRHPRVHAAGLRDRRDHQVLRDPAVQGARGELRGARHPPGRQADAHRHGPPVRVRRGGLRRHLRERPGRAAHRLPVPDRQPAWGNRARHRRPLRAGARLVHLRRRRPDVALHGQLRRPEDPDPAPDPLGRRQRAARRARTTRSTSCSPRSSGRRSPPSWSRRARARRPQATEASIGPYALHDFTLFHVLRYGFRPSKIAFLAEHAWSDASTGEWPPNYPEEQPAGVRPGARSGTGSRCSSSGSSPASSSGRRCPTGRRSAPAARCRRAATGGCPATPAPPPGWPSSRTSRALRAMTGTAVLVVQHQDDCPPALVGEWLVEAGCELDVRRPYAGDDLPDDLARPRRAPRPRRVDGRATTTTAHPWLAATKALVRDAAQRRTPTLGICLGHQLVAVALGGEVGRNPRGQQLGLLPMGWTDAAARRRPDGHGPGRRPTSRRALERRHRRARAGQGPWCSPAPPTASSRWPGSRRRCGASSCTPRSTSTSSRRGPTRTATATPRACSRTSSPRSPPRATSLVAGWRPLAQAFARQMAQVP